MPSTLIPATASLPGSPFDGAEILHAYTRQQAIADGVLVDMQEGDASDVTRQHLGTMPVAITSGLWALIQRAVSHPRHMNDLKGVWHDILWMAMARVHVVSILRQLDAGQLALSDLPKRWDFRVTITGTGRTKVHTLRAAVTHGDDGHPVFLVSLPGED